MSLTLPWMTPRVQDAAQPDFLGDVFAPVSGETEATALRVEGRLPEGLKGLYARIGPNPIKPPSPAVITGSLAMAWCTA